MPKNRLPRAAALALPLLAGALVLFSSGCGGGGQNPWNAQRAPHVLASFPPIYCFAANVADPRAEVRSLMVENDPHSFDPTIQHSWLIRGADVFYANGLGLDDGIVSRLRSAAGRSKVRIVNLGEEIPEKERITTDGSTDPHIWLGIPEAIQMVHGIRDDLKKQYPERARIYEDNAAGYVAKLRKLQEEGDKAFAGIKPEDRKFIAFHDSMHYFARAFKLEVAGVVEYEPGTAATPQRLEELVKICQEKGVRVIVSEPGLDRDGEAQRLCNSLRNRGVKDAEVVEMDPLETAPAAELDTGYYEKVMRKNIQNLAAKLSRTAR